MIDKSILAYYFGKGETHQSKQIDIEINHFFKDINEIEVKLISGQKNYFINIYEFIVNVGKIHNWHLSDLINVELGNVKNLKVENSTYPDLEENSYRIIDENEFTKKLHDKNIEGKTRKNINRLTKDANKVYLKNYSWNHKEFFFQFDKSYKYLLIQYHY